VPERDDRSAAEHGTSLSYRAHGELEQASDIELLAEARAVLSLRLLGGRSDLLHADRE
jgi:hypothetical protein